MDRKLKAIFTDFDGTLANGVDGVIPPEVETTIHTLRNAGVSIHIVTGRRFGDKESGSTRIADACKELNLEGPQVASAGAEIRDAQSGTLLASHFIQEDVAKEIVADLKTRTIPFFVETLTHTYCHNGAERFFRDPDDRPKTVQPIEYCTYQQITKIVSPADVALLKKPEVMELEKYLMHTYSTIHVTKFQEPGEYNDQTNFGFDVTDAGATKHIGALEIMKRLDLKKEEVLAIGDSYNDFPLFYACGTTVAMGNAAPELQEIADVVVKPIWELGFIEMVERYFD